MKITLAIYNYLTILKKAKDPLLAVATVVIQNKEWEDLKKNTIVGLWLIVIVVVIASQSLIRV